eukprot:g526.t1
MSIRLDSSENSETRAPLLGSTYKGDSPKKPTHGVCSTVCDSLLNTWNFVLDFMKTMVCHLAALLAVIFPLKQMSLTTKQEERLRDLWLRVQIPFDENNTEHKTVLMDLWQAAFPDTPWTGQKSKQWSLMGWQGLDPITDLRGGGFLALECLLDLHQRNARLFNKLMTKSEGVRSEWEYPFAVAGVNVTFELIQMFHLRDTHQLHSTKEFKSFLNLLEKNEMTFEDLYGIMFELLDKNWLDQKASYMEFSIVMKKTRNQMLEVLSTMPSDVEEIKQLVAL